MVNAPDNKVMYIEDDDSHAEIFSYYAKEVFPEIEIQRLCDGEEAISFLNQNQEANSSFPNLILLDLNLPKFNGQEVLKAIKTHPVARRIPVVVMSSSVAEGDVFSAYASGANSYIRKPDEAGHFKPVILDILNYWNRNVIDSSIYISK